MTEENIERIRNLGPSQLETFYRLLMRETGLNRHGEVRYQIKAAILASDDTILRVFQQMEKIHEGKGSANFVGEVESGSTA